jgi:hypothetical protein
VTASDADTGVALTSNVEPPLSATVTVGPVDDEVKRADAVGAAAPVGVVGAVDAA